MTVRCQKSNTDSFSGLATDTFLETGDYVHGEAQINSELPPARVWGFRLRVFSNPTTPKGWKGLVHLKEIDQKWYTMSTFEKIQGISNFSKVDLRATARWRIELPLPTLGRGKSQGLNPQPPKVQGLRTVLTCAPPPGVVGLSHTKCF